MTMLALQALDGGVTAKRWRPDGSVEGYSKTVWWRPVEGRPRSLEQMHYALQRLAMRSDMCVVRGAEIEPGKQRIMRRLKGEGAALRDADRPWIVGDFDTVATPPALLPLMGTSDGNDAAVAYLRGLVPPWLSEAGLVLQWSQSAGRDGWARLKAHVWWWLDRAVCCASLGRWAKKQPHIDAATLRPVQPIYTADPIIEDGWMGRPSPSVVIYPGPPAKVPKSVLSLEDHAKVVAEEERARQAELERARAASAWTGDRAQRSQAVGSLARLIAFEEGQVLNAGEGGRHNAIVKAVRAVSLLASELGLPPHDGLRTIAEAGRRVLPQGRHGEVDAIISALGAA